MFNERQKVGGRREEERKPQDLKEQDHFCRVEHGGQRFNRRLDRTGLMDVSVQEWSNKREDKKICCDIFGTGVWSLVL